MLWLCLHLRIFIIYIYILLVCLGVRLFASNIFHNYLREETDFFHLILEYLYSTRLLGRFAPLL